MSLSPKFAVLAVIALSMGCAEDPAPADLGEASAVSTDPLAAALAPQPEGQWITLPELMSINPIHAVLLNESISRSEREAVGNRVGTVLVVAGSGDYWAPPANEYKVINFATGVDTTSAMYFDAFCVGITVLATGNPFLAGGTMAYEPEITGLADVAIFNKKTSTFIAKPSMAHGRWYPTTTLLGDGRVMVDTGWDENGDMNDTVEIYTPGSGWSPEYPMGWDPPFYLRKHLLPDGRVFMSGPETESRYFDPAVVSTFNSGWTHAAWTNYGTEPNQYWREYGSSVLLGLTPENGYNPTVMIMGGNRENPTDTTEFIDLGAAVPAWRWGPDMISPRVRMQATLLPDGTVLTLGGSTVDYDDSTGVLEAELYHEDTDTYSPAGTMAFARLDHSVSLLLPDATVWVAGSQRTPPDYEQNTEIYRPAYLFNPDGSLATRPVIDTAPRAVGYDAPFTVQTGEAADISRVVLMKPGAVTHSFNTDQRQVGLSFEVTSANSLTVQSPPDSNIAPPGYYMMFLLNSAGVPSVAMFVQVR